MRKQGYVGTIEVETEGTDRFWVSLTDSDAGGNWVTTEENPGIRAWFQESIEEGEHRPVQLAKLALLLDAMREGYQVEVYSPDGIRTDISRMTAEDTYNATSVRALRTGIHF